MTGATTTKAMGNEPGSLRQRSVRGGAWSTIGFGASSALRLCSNLILVRFIAPDAFGLMAVALSLVIWLGMMTDLGINASVIREKEGETQDFINVAWTVQFIRNIIIAAILCIAAAALFLARDIDWLPANSAYRDAAMPPLILFVSLSTVIGSLQTLGAAICNRHLDFKRLVPIEIATQIVGSGVTVAFAVAGAGVWSLAYGMIANSATMAAATYLLGGRPSRLSLDPVHRRTIINYGKWILVSSFLSFILLKGDTLIFGGLVDKELLGFYAVAGTWVMALQGFIGMMMKRLFYPIFAEIHRERPEDMNRIYAKTRDLVDLCISFAFVGAAFAGNFLVGLIYPDSYASVGKYITLMSISILYMPTEILQTIILSAGESRRYSATLLGPAIAILVLTPLVYRLFGFDAAVIAAMSAKIFALPVIWSMVKGRISLSIWREARMPLLALVSVAGFVMFY